MTRAPFRSAAELEPGIASSDLLPRWVAAAAALGAPPAAARNVGERSLAALQRGAYAYSSVARLGRVVTVVDRLDHRSERPDAVLVTAWLHVVGAEQAGGARRLLPGFLAELRLPPPATRRVERLLDVARAGTADYEDADGRVVCDAVLADLGASPAEYTDTVERQRMQQGYDDGMWPAVRRATIEALARRDSVFTTPEMRATREPRAQLNLAREAALLRSPADVG